MKKDSKEVLLDLGLKDLELVSLMNYHFKYTYLYQVVDSSDSAMVLNSIITLLEESTEDYVVDLIQELDDHISSFTSVANKIINKVAKEIINLIKVRYVLFILLDKLAGLYDLSSQGVTGKDEPVLYISTPTAAVTCFQDYTFTLRAYEAEFYIRILPTYSGTAKTTSIDKVKDLEVKIEIENLTRPGGNGSWYAHVYDLKPTIDKILSYQKI